MHPLDLHTFGRLVTVVVPAKARLADLQIRARTATQRQPAMGEQRVEVGMGKRRAHDRQPDTPPPSRGQTTRPATVTISGVSVEVPVPNDADLSARSQRPRQLFSTGAKRIGRCGNGQTARATLPTPTIVFRTAGSPPYRTVPMPVMVTSRLSLAATVASALPEIVTFTLLPRRSRAR